MSYVPIHSANSLKSRYPHNVDISLSGHLISGWLAQSNLTIRWTFRAGHMIMMVAGSQRIHCINCVTSGPYSHGISCEMHFVSSSFFKTYLLPYLQGFRNPLAILKWLLFLSVQRCSFTHSLVFIINGGHNTKTAFTRHQLIKFPVPPNPFLWHSKWSNHWVRLGLTSKFWFDLYIESVS